MSENTSDKKNKVPNYYLFTGYYKGDRLVSKLKPLPNTLVLAGDPATVTVKDGEPVLLRTNQNGVMHGLSEKEDTLLAPKNPYAIKIDEEKAGEKSPPVNLTLTLPPMEAAVFFALKHGKIWQQEFINKFKTFGNGEFTSVNLPLQNTKYEQLAKPDKNEVEYKAWYDTLNKSTVFKGFVLPKTRGIFFVFSNIVVFEKIKNITIRIPGKSEIDKIPKEKFERSENKDFYIAMQSGSLFAYPDGMYEITVHFEETPNSKHWSGNIAGHPASGKIARKSYSLSAMARFDYAVPGGEFSLIMCDPISLEEALVNQFPVQYVHIIEEGINFKAMASSPTNLALSDGLNNIVKSVGFTKSYTELTANVGKIGGRSKAAKVLGKAFNEKFGKALYPPVASVLDLTLAWAGCYETADEFVKAVKSAKDFLAENRNKNLKKAMLSDFRASFGKVDTDEFKLAKALKVDDKFIKKLGKIVAVAEIGDALISVAASVSGVMGARGEREKSVANLQKIVDHYMTVIQYTAIEEVIIKVLFDTGESAVKNEFTEHLGEIAEHLIEHDDITLHMDGFTDNDGTNEYNETLSQNRVDEVKEKLVKLGVKKDRIIARGMGKAIPSDFNQNEKNKTANRRVSATFKKPGQKGAPCREGIQSCERYRNQGVRSQIKVSEAYWELAEKSLDLALNVMSLVPVTAAAALAFTLVKDVYNASSKSLNFVASIADYIVLDDKIAAYRDEKKEEGKRRDEANANQSLLGDLFENGKLAEAKVPVSQYHIRAEAINGLLNLIIRAQASAMEAENGGEDKSLDKSLAGKLKKYRVEEYIENFILNDQWIYPVKRFSSLTMDQMWLFSTNPFNTVMPDADEDVDTDTNTNTGTGTGTGIDIPIETAADAEAETEADIDKKPVNDVLINSFGLNKNYKLMSTMERLKLLPSAIIENDISGVANYLSASLNLLSDVVNTAGFDGSDLQQSGTQIMRIGNSVLETDVQANFQHLYPIHHFDSKNVEQFAESFQITWPKFKIFKLSIYQHTAIYIWKNLATESDKSAGRWELLVDPERRKIPGWENKVKQLNPFSRIKIVIIFNKNKVKGYASVNLELHRVDGINVQGPTYKSTTKLLQKRDIDGLEGLDDYVGNHYACIFEPLYQFSNATILAVKPMIPRYWKKGFYYSNIQDYYNSGNMNDMRYAFRVIAGKRNETKLWLPLMSDTYDCKEGDSRSIYKSTMHKPGPGGGTFEMNRSIDSLPNEVHMKLDAREPEQNRLLIRDFLLSNTQDKAIIHLFEKNIEIVPLIRIGGKANPWVAAKGSAFENDFKKYTRVSIEASLAGYFSAGKSVLKINNFTWKESVEFAFVLSCKKLRLDSCLKADRSPYAIAGSAEMKEKNFMFQTHVKGPVIAGLKFEYIGQLNKISAIESRFNYLKKPPYVAPEIKIEASAEDANGKKSEKDGKKEVEVEAEANVNDLIAAKLKEPREPSSYKNIQDIINILKNPGSKENKEKFDALNNYHQMHNGSDRYYYIAYKKMQYVSPKGLTVESIRPFGKDKMSDKEGTKDDDYFEYEIINFKTEDGFKVADEINTVRSYTNATGVAGVIVKKAHYFKKGPYAFHFQSPDNLLENQPWTKPVAAEKLDKIKRVTAYKKSANLLDKLDYDEALAWLEKNPQDLHMRLDLSSTKGHDAGADKETKGRE